MTQFECVAADAWNRTLAVHEIPADTYVSREWLEACAIIEGGNPVFLTLTSDCGAHTGFLALLVREIVGGVDRESANPGKAVGIFRDATTPYGYGGVVTTESTPTDTSFDAALNAWAEVEQVVAMFTRFHPRFSSARFATQGTAITELASVIAWRTDAPSDDAIFEAMHSRHRRVVRKSRKLGTVVRATRGAEPLERFTTMYDETMRRQNADSFYFFPEEYWRALADGFGEQLIFFEGEIKGDAAASLLCIEGDGWLNYHLGASTDPGRAAGASNHCFFEAACWARQNGCDRLLLGGGVGGGEDSLHDFKRRFDEQGLLPMLIGKTVFDRDTFAALGGNPDDLTGFFPPWRSRG